MKMTGAADRSALEFIVGNAIAIFAGLAACYVALVHVGAVTMKDWDFVFYFSGSRLLLLGHGSSLYNTHTLGLLEASLVSPLQVPDGGMPYVYPPFLAILQVPLSALPYEAAYLVWLAINAILLAAALFYWERYARVPARRSRLIRFATLLSIPVVAALLLGQTSILLLAALTVVFFAARARSDWLAGASLAIVLVKPQYTIPFLLVFMVRRRWTVLAGFAAASFVLFLVPAAIMGISIDHSYFETLRQATQWRSQVPGFQPTLNRSLAGLTELLLPSGVASVFTAVLDVVALAGLVRAASRCPKIDLPLGLATTVALLVSPHVLIHDLSLLIIPVAVALHRRELGPSRLNQVLIFLYISILVGFGLSVVTPIQLPAIGMCALAAWLYSSGLNRAGGSLADGYSVAAHPDHRATGGTPTAAAPIAIEAQNCFSRSNPA